MKAVVVSGEGRAFCAGLDVRDVASTGRVAVDELLDRKNGVHIFPFQRETPLQNLPCLSVGCADASFVDQFVSFYGFMQEHTALVHTERAKHEHARATGQHGTGSGVRLATHRRTSLSSPPWGVPWRRIADCARSRLSRSHGRLQDLCA